MTRSRRKFEELLWLAGLHAQARSLYGATLGRKGAAHRQAIGGFYAALLPPGSLVFDIGANTGILSAIFSSLKAKVIAIEPNADCVRHIEISYPGPSIEVIHAAAGPKNGIAVLHQSDRRDDISSLSDGWISAIQQQHKEYNGLWAKRVVVPILTLDSLREHYGMPYFIKIDVEGFEESVLDGLSVQPPLLSFEFNLAYRQAALRCLEKKVFGDSSQFNFAMGDPVRFEMSDWAGKDRIWDILSRLPDGDRHGDIFVKRSAREQSSRTCE